MKSFTVPRYYEFMYDKTEDFGLGVEIPEPPKEDSSIILYAEVEKFRLSDSLCIRIKDSRYKNAIPKVTAYIRLDPNKNEEEKENIPYKIGLAFKMAMD